MGTPTVVLVPGSKVAREAGLWIASLWGELPVVQWLRAGAGDDPNKLPVVLGRIGPEGKLLAVVAILEDDLPSRTDLSPWIGCLLVREDFRRKGIGRMMMEAALSHASRLAFDRVFLFASPTLERYYLSQGWVTDMTAFDDDEMVVIMSKCILR